MTYGYDCVYEYCWVCLIAILFLLFYVGLMFYCIWMDKFTYFPRRNYQNQEAGPVFIVQGIPVKQKFQQDIKEQEIPRSTQINNV